MCPSLAAHATNGFDPVSIKRPERGSYYGITVYYGYYGDVLR